MRLSAFERELRSLERQLGMLANEGDKQVEDYDKEIEAEPAEKEIDEQYDEALKEQDELVESSWEDKSEVPSVPEGEDGNQNTKMSSEQIACEIAQLEEELLMEEDDLGMPVDDVMVEAPIVDEMMVEEPLLEDELLSMEEELGMDYRRSQDEVENPVEESDKGLIWDDFDEVEKEIGGPEEKPEKPLDVVKDSTKFNESEYVTASRLKEASRRLDRVAAALESKGGKWVKYAYRIDKLADMLDAE